MIIKILGSGCTKCKKLYHNTILALSETEIKAEVIKVTEFAEIAKYNVMQTPALVFDNIVVSKGKLLSKDEIVSLLKR